MRDLSEAGRDGGRAANPSRLMFYEDSFVFDSVAGTFYRLNPAAAFVLRALDNGTRPEQLPELLQSRYGIDHKSAVRDAELFVNDLAALGLDPGGVL